MTHDGTFSGGSTNCNKYIMGLQFRNAIMTFPLLSHIFFYKCKLEAHFKGFQQFRQVGQLDISGECILFKSPLSSASCSCVLRELSSLLFKTVMATISSSECMMHCACYWSNKSVCFVTSLGPFILLCFFVRFSYLQVHCASLSFYYRFLEFCAYRVVEYCMQLSCGVCSPFLSSSFFIGKLVYFSVW